MTTHYLAPNGCSAAEALIIIPEGQSVSRTAQALADRLGVTILAYIEIGGAHWPDERLGDWGSFDPRPAR